jgi:hypothetical protein
MPNAIQWDGKTWQEWVNKLLKVRYAENYRPISASDSGDGGLEGFTVCGKSYQCYCPESSTLKKWKQDVQEKMNTDLKKLKKNEKKLVPLLGGVKLKSWHLVVPEDRSKDLMAHCNAKALECKGWGLGILADDFFVTLETEENWPAESSALQNARASRIDFRVTRARSADLSQWRDGNVEHFKNVRRKCGIMSGRSNELQQEWESKIIQYYIEGQNAMSAIRTKYPDIFENITSLKEQKEQYLLEVTSTANGQSAMRVFNEVIADMKAAIKTELPNASDNVIDALTREATSDWLMRCPLDFRGA